MSPVDPASQPQEDGPSRDEKTPWRLRPLVLGGIGFFAFVTALLAIVWILLLHESQSPWPERKPPAPPSANAGWNHQVPQVQINPALDLVQLRLAADRRLHTLRWNDATHAYVAIPIEDAMKLMADASARGQLTTLLPAPRPATPIELQNQKSQEAAPTGVPRP